MKPRSERPVSHRRWVAFLVVGAMGFVLQMAAFEWLTDVAGWTWLRATVVAVEAAILHNFVWHQRWTWADRPVEGVLSRLAAFHTANGATSLVGNVTAMALYAGWLRLPYLLAMTLAVATTSVVNFLLADRCVFRCGGAIALVVLAAAPAPASAVPARSETLAAWDRYIAGVESTHAPAEISAADRARLEAGEIVVSRACGQRCPADIDVPSGRIEHWRGAVFVKGISVDASVAALERAPLMQEDVVRARVLEHAGGAPARAGRRSGISLAAERVRPLLADGRRRAGAVRIGDAQPRRPVPAATACGADHCPHRA